VTISSYELILADTNHCVATQGSEKDDFCVDYDKLTENLSPGKYKFKVYFYFILIICFANFNLFILLYSQSI
jgi:hypothetical protein